MASETSSRRLLAGAVAALLTAGLVWFGTGLDPWWPLLWFAPLPVLLFALASNAWQGALAAFLGWGLGSLNLWGYYHGVLHLPSGILARIFVSLAVVFTLAVVLFRALARRRCHWSALIAFPALWVSFEYLLSVTSPHGTAGSLSYSQLAFLPLLQIASVTGPWGASFVVLLFAPSLALAWHLRRAAPKQALRIGATGIATIGAVLVFGVIRLAAPASEATVRVGLIASDSPSRIGVADENAPTDQLFRDYAAPISTLAAQGAQVIVLPEKLGVVVEPDTRATDAILQSLADGLQIEVVAGLIHVTPPVKYNEARIYSPHAAVRSYYKHHLLPPHESKLTPGTQLTILDKPAAPWGVAICKDMDFTPLSRIYGRSGVGLMLVPAWDFNVDRLAHGHMAIMRGVESGFAIARSAKQGYITVSDNRGRVLAESRSDAAPFATLLVDVPAVHADTLYQRFGDWFAWLALGLFAFSVARATIAAIQGRAAQP